MTPQPSVVVSAGRAMRGVLAFLPVFARLTRASFLELRDRDFVTTARARGAGDAALIARHILPHTLSPLIVQATISFPVAIRAEAGLAYLGLNLLGDGLRDLLEPKLAR